MISDGTHVLLPVVAPKGSFYSLPSSMYYRKNMINRNSYYQLPEGDSELDADSAPNLDDVGK